MDRYHFKTYLQTPVSFFSKHQRIFEAGTKNILSTKTPPTKDKLESESSPNQDSKTQDFFYLKVATNESGTTYSDLTAVRIPRIRNSNRSPKPTD